MPQASVKRIINCKKKKLIELVLDIEKYPEFVPFCQNAKIYSNETSENINNILVICPGFASDCVETLEEILIQGKQSFVSAGGDNFDMVPCLLIKTSF